MTDIRSNAAIYQIPYDLLARGAVAKRVLRAAHPLVLIAVVEKGHRIGDDPLSARADEPRCARVDAFRPLGGFTHHEDGFAEGRRLLLDAARVGEDERAPLHHPDKGQVV